MISMDDDDDDDDAEEEEVVEEVRCCVAFCRSRKRLVARLLVSSVAPRPFRPFRCYTPPVPPRARSTHRFSASFAVAAITFAGGSTIGM